MKNFPFRKTRCTALKVEYDPTARRHARGIEGLRDGQQHEAELTGKHQTIAKAAADLDSYKKFVFQKTEQLPKEFECKTVQGC